MDKEILLLSEEIDIITNLILAEVERLKQFGYYRSERLRVDLSAEIERLMRLYDLLLTPKK